MALANDPEKNAAEKALYEQIETAAKAAAGLASLVTRARVLKDLAVSYRAVKGGPQPGSVDIDVKSS